jgi:hypothetical protein
MDSKSTIIYQQKLAEAQVHAASAPSMSNKDAWSEWRNRQRQLEQQVAMHNPYRK